MVAAEDADVICYMSVDYSVANILNRYCWDARSRIAYHQRNNIPKRPRPSVNFANQSAKNDGEKQCADEEDKIALHTISVIKG